MQVLILLFVLFGAWVGIDAAAPMPSSSSIFNEAELKHIAETQGYGYKTANLQMLQRVCQDFNATKQARQIAVPAFVGVPSAAVQAKIALDLRSLWAPVVAAMGDHAIALEKKQFADGFQTAQEAFMVQLDAAWFRLALGESATLNAFFGVDGIDQLLAAVAARGNRLMVRSTGKEDTKEFANAGGNESVANVEPTAAAILAAMGTVVKSYFGMKSLSQRLGLGDRSLFSGQIFIPVLIQEMIGEKAGKEIPRCGVMFTEEPEGHVAQAAAAGGAGGEAAVGPAYSVSGITLIQAAYGHNEGVVNSLIPVDTYYAMHIPGQDQPAIYPVVRAKTTRLVPGVGGMQRIENAKGMLLSRALTNQELYTLKALADKLEDFFGYAVDVEFVIKNKTIYLVQARPLVHHASDVPASYLRDELAGQQIAGSTIVAAGGGVRVLNTAAQVIIAPTIGAALDYYLYDPACTPAVVQAVIVGIMAPSTSHEATTFRNEGKPVMCVSDISLVDAQLKDGKKLLFSPQQNMVAVVDEIADGDIIQGWISYPMPRALSVLPELLGARGMGVQEVGMPSSSRGGKASRKRSREERRIIERWSILLERMKKGTQIEVAEAVSKLLIQWQTIEKKYKKDSALAADAAQLTSGIQRLCSQVIAMAAITYDSPQYLKRLLPIHMLESLIYQHENRVDMLLPLSIATLGKALAQEYKITQTVPMVPAAVKDYYVQLQKVHEVIYAESVHEAWDQLLAALTTAPGAGPIAFFASLTGQLTNLDVLPMWLHTIFYHDVQALGATNIEALLTKWQTDVVRDKEFLALMSAMQTRCKSIDIGAFAKPRSCEVAWEDFLREIVTYFAGPFLAAFSPAGDIGKMAAIQTMHTLVMIFDEVIKSTKGSRLLKNDKKLPLFQAMLQANFQLLRAWVSLVPDRRILEANSSVVSRYFEMMQILTDKPFKPSDLLPTNGVQTFIFAMGSGHDWFQDSHSNKQPATGEDVFSIMHQSLLTCCGALSLPYLAIVEKPPLIKSIEAILLSTNPGKSGSPCKPIGFAVRNKGPTFFYNVPLGSHSCQIELRYNNKKQQGQIRLLFCGGFDRERIRWTNIAIVALFDSEHRKVSGLPYISLSIDKLANQLLEMTLVVKEPGDIEQLSRLWQELIGLANGKPIKSKYCRTFLNDAINVDKILNSFNGFGKVKEEAERVVYKILVPQLIKNVYQGRDFAKGIRYAILGMSGADDDMWYAAVDLWIALFAQSQGYEQAIVSATAGMLHADNSIKEMALSLFQELVKANQGYEQAIAAAQVGMESGCWEAQELFSDLVTKGHGYAEAIQTASVCVASEDYYLRSNGIKLFKVLWRQGQGYEEAVAVVQRLVEQGKGRQAKELNALLPPEHQVSGV